MNKETEINTPHHRINEGGNAIFMVILGVALFAALGYAFNSSNRTSTALLTDEQASVYANQIIAYGNEVKQAVKRLNLRGVDETEISFGNTVFTQVDSTVIQPENHNTNCTNDKCNVFKIGGGGLTAQIAPNGSYQTVTRPGGYAASGHWVAHEISFQDIGSNAVDLVWTLHDVTEKVCIKINDLLGVNNPSGLPPEDDLTGNQNFDGTYDGTAVWGDDDAALTGEKAGCYESTIAGAGYYQYSLAVLIR